MIKKYLPELIELFTEIGVKPNEITELSLNEKLNGCYVLTNHKFDYCRTNQYRGEGYTKQLHLCYSQKSQNWEQKEPGCGHASFEQLTEENISPNWKTGLIVQKKGAPMYLKRASSNC